MMTTEEYCVRQKVRWGHVCKTNITLLLPKLWSKVFACEYIWIKSRKTSNTDIHSRGYYYYYRVRSIWVFILNETKQWDTNDGDCTKMSTPTKNSQTEANLPKELLCSYVEYICQLFSHSYWETVVFVILLFPGLLTLVQHDHWHGNDGIHCYRFWLFLLFRLMHVASSEHHTPLR